tara:strand:+ start:380 stop:625 length:246 start_codon:yes stop_codon:yes gene_type:complete
MTNEMQWTDNDLLLQRTNEEHRIINGDLRIENSLLRETVEELYGVLSNMDFDAQNIFRCGDMPWKKWCAVVSREPIQLKLF